MASALKQALKWAKNLPWNVTGPTSHPEYRDSLTNVKDYRAFSPATPSKKAIVPRSDPDHVFNITYFSRFPGRRKMFPASSSDKETSTDNLTNGSLVSAKASIDEPKDRSVKEKRLPSPSIYRLGYSVPLDDCPGDGYQK
ncbi:hypothetical protein KP509_03G070200 [Ceratopteris richardii]|uniref:Uncharacterized protein n=1 Tax=Ceratopteris richardii TaxID=49495 RepID=A0A8T2V0Z5_CERRI|nr:hypothetical protein KP509_03G070200 [Ceratopteris richardii]